MTRLFHLRPAAVPPDTTPQRLVLSPTTETDADLGGISEFIAASATAFRSSREALAFGLVLGAELGRTYPELAPRSIEDVFELRSLPEPRPFVDQLIRLAKRSEREARSRDQLPVSSRVQERLALVATLRPAGA